MIGDLSGVRKALIAEGLEDVVVERVLDVWPLAAEILEAFSKATMVPIFVFLGSHHLFVSEDDVLPEFCRLLLASESTARLCLEDGGRRAARRHRDGPVLCHAGRITRRATVDLDVVGSLTVLFGARKGQGKSAERRQREVMHSVRAHDEALAGRLEAAAQRDCVVDTGDDEGERKLIEAIVAVLEQLFSLTIGAFWATMNLSHELAHILNGAFFFLKDIREEIALQMPSSFAREIETPLISTQQQLECGVVLVRNYVSSASRLRYRSLPSGRWEAVNVDALIQSVAEIYEKDKDFQMKALRLEIQQAPRLFLTLGIDLELRRLFHNLLSNAVKYSYRSVAGAERYISIRWKETFDPGFRSERYSVVVENYGLGLHSQEIASAFRASYRGEQARLEVPVGAGLGLGEARRIARFHGGDVRLQSEQVHESAEGVKTYKTTLEVVLPYLVDKGSDRRSG